MRRIKRALSITKAPKIEECLADIHEHHEVEGCHSTVNGTVENDDQHIQSNNNKVSDGMRFAFIFAVIKTKIDST